MRLEAYIALNYFYNPGIPLGCQIQEICVLRFYILIWFLIRLEDMNLIHFEFGVMISIWFCYVYDMVWVLVWIWFGNVLDVNLIWFGNGAPFSGFPTGWLQERKQKQPGTAF